MRRPILPLILAAALLALLTTPALAAEPTGRLLVLLRPHAGAGPGARAAAATAVIARAGARRAGASAPAIGLVSVRPAHGKRLAHLARRLRRDPAVASVQAERRFTLRATPNDPALTRQEPAAGAPPDTPIEWWAWRQGFPAAWEAVPGDGALVGLIDTGVDGTHPELAGRIAATVNQDADPADGPATTDGAGHGTHVASLACANTGNGIGLAAAGGNCSLIVEKSDLTEGSVAASIVDAVDRGALAVNMSFGTDGGSPAATAVVRAIDYAYRRGVVLVAAAADEDVQEQGDPANVLQPTGTGSDITQGRGLSVTAASFADQRATFAGRGSQISLAAYGTFGGPNAPRGIFGAFPANATQLESGVMSSPPSPCRCRSAFDGDARYAYVQGTSMAAPMVTAAAALVRKLNPDLRAADVIRLLKQTAHRPAGTGWTPELGWGILDAGAAVAAALAIDRTAPTSRLRARGRTRKRSFVLRWSGVDTAPPGVTVSGLVAYDVYRVVRGRRPVRIAHTAKPWLRVRGRAGGRYGFYTRAIDAVGNVEAAPAKPDAVVRIRR
jgi:subtilisin family serine protease